MMTRSFVQLTRLSALALAMLAACVCAQDVYAQETSDWHMVAGTDMVDGAGNAWSTEMPKALPIIDADNGEIRALLLLEQTQTDAALSDAQLLDQILAPQQVETPAPMIAASLPDVSQDMALLCKDASPLALTLHSMAENCLLSSMHEATTNSVAASEWLQPQNMTSARIQHQWALDQDQTMMAGLGFSARTLDSAAQQFGLSAPSPSAVTSLVDGQSAQLQGYVTLPRAWWLQLSGGRSEWTSNNSLLGVTRMQSDNLGFGVGKGNVGGQLIGRVVELPSSGAKATSFDVDLMWRMPWQAKLTFGTRAIFKDTPVEGWPEASLGEQDDDEWVPYVRYHQDL